MNHTTAALKPVEMGPAIRNNDLQTLREHAVPRGVANMFPIYADRASGDRLWDVEGKAYVDFATGIATVNTGHNHPRVVAAVREQLERFSHTCFQVTPYEPYVRLADRLNHLAPGPRPKKTIFLTTGAEAVENAVKIARAHTKRSGVIAFSGGFHGRTMMGMALTGKVVPYKVGFGPMPSEVYHLPFPCTYLGVSAEDSLQALETLFKSDVEPSRVAAMIIEPVQGEGGFYIAPPEFLRRLRTVCDEHGIVLIVDEIQTGFGRTGKMFAIEHADIEPDLITMAKSLAGGFPLSAVTGIAEIMDAPEPGGLGGTYGGPPIACAAAHAVIDVIAEENLLERADSIGTKIESRLREMTTDNELGGTIGDIRRLGAMVAVELVVDGKVAKPSAEITKATVQNAADAGLIVLACGVRGNVVRFLPALVASDDTIDQGMTIFENALRQAVVRAN